MRGGLQGAVPALLGLAILCVGLTGCGGRVSDRDIRTISLDEVVQLYAKDRTKPNTLELIDPRPRSSYARGHIAGAKHIELNRLDPQLGRDRELDKADMLVVYGNNRSSAIARAAVKRLLDIGYKRSKVRWFAGGLAEWSASGRPVDTVPEELETDPVPAPAPAGGG